MKELQAKQNTQAVSTEWPHGGIIDETGSNNGTRVNREFMNDYVQTFERIFALSGLSANGQLDNNTNGFQMYNATRKMFRPYTVYTALVTQTGTSAPTATVLGMNDIGAIVWTRVAAGNYKGTLAGAFPANKVFAFGGVTVSSAATISLLRNTDDEILLLVRNDSGTSVDAALTNSPIEIRVYDLNLV